MVDEEQLSDVDARLRAALLPDRTATRRVLLAAISQTVRLKADATGTSVVQTVRRGLKAVPYKSVRRGRSLDRPALGRPLPVFLGGRTRIASRRSAIVAVAVGMLAFAVAAGLWRRHAAAPVAPAMTSLKVTSRGSLIVVEGADGRRWIVGPAAERRAEGHYVIVISE